MHTASDGTGHNNPHDTAMGTDHGLRLTAEGHMPGASPGRSTMNLYNLSLCVGIPATSPTMVLDKPLIKEIENGVFIIDRIDRNGFLTPSLAEVVSFESLSATHFLISRGLNATSAQAHSAGAIVELIPDIHRYSKASMTLSAYLQKHLFHSS